MADAEDQELASEPSGVVPEEKAPREPFVVIQQALDIEINFREKSIQGKSTIVVFPFSDDLEEVRIDARQCGIDTENITVNNEKVEVDYEDPYMLLVPRSQWTLTARQHSVLTKHLHSLMPRRLAEHSVVESQNVGCVTALGSLRVKLPRKDQGSDLPRRSIVLKAKGPKGAEDGVALKGSDASELTISIPFRTTNIRDGLHFAGVEEGDSRYPHAYTRHAVEPGMASCIFPCIDDPGSRVPWTINITCPRTLGDALEQPLASQPVFGATQDGSRKRRRSADETWRAPNVLTEEEKLLEMTVICSGVLTGETEDSQDASKKVMHFETTTSVGAQHIGFAVGPFEHVELWSEFRSEEVDDKLGANATKVHGYCLPGRADEVRNTCSPLVLAADYFGPHLGKYPYDSYKVCFVEDMVSDTAEACSLSLCSTRLLYPEEIIDTEIETTRILVHSLACQFVGVNLVPNKRSDTWLVIGMQWYMTDVFMKELCGNNTYRFHQKTSADKLVEMDVDRPSLHDLGAHLHLGDFELEFMALKAPLLLFILDQRMKKIPGNTGVLRVISKMISTANINEGSAELTSASTDAFVKLCEKQSQVRCDTFLRQWVLGSGCPRLFTKQKFNKKTTSVELYIFQTQADRFKPGPDGNPPKRRLQKEEFWREFRELQEETHGLFAKEVQAHFTGPMSIQIHEADGRPYEHLVEIQENHLNGAEFKITYYTKYRRLKKKRRQKEVAGAVARAEGKDETQEDVVYYTCFGDVLQSEADITGWGLGDWGEEEQSRIGNESYEWIGIDTDFEWICEKRSDMSFHMYLAQLQQDRDVVAQQDSLLAIARGWVHPMASTILARTLMDQRYFHGIRTMAARDLPRQAVREMNMIGLAHLILSYRYQFCFRVGSQSTAEGPGINNNRDGGDNTQSSRTVTGSFGDGNANGAAQPGSSAVDVWSPQPNDFSDKSQYAIQCTIPGAVGRVRDETKRCPKSAREFLLELLTLNDNSDNIYSDHFYVGKLLEALTTSIITEVDDRSRELVHALDVHDEADAEFKGFIERVIEEIDRYRRMDEWTLTYHNIWTTTALECKRRLMKARIIPTSAIEFVQYVQEGNLDLVRIKAYEVLIDLGLTLKPPILKLLLSTMSGDPSPFVRARMFKAFCRGVAAIALGETKKASTAAARPEDGDEDEDDLIVEGGDVTTDSRRVDEARKMDLGIALKALKDELRGNAALANGIWQAVQSPNIGLAEVRDLLCLCSAMFDDEDSLIFTFRYPRVWRVARGQPERRRLMMTFTSSYRTAPRTVMGPPPAPEPAAAPPAPEQQIAEPPRPPEPKRIKLQTRPSMTSLAEASNAPSPETKPSAPAIAAKPVVSDTISVLPPVLAARRTASSTPGPSTPPKPAATGRGGSETPAGGKPKSNKKRKGEEEGSERPKKIVKKEDTSSRIVTFKINYSKVSPEVRRSLASSTPPKSTVSGNRASANNATLPAAASHSTLSQRASVGSPAPRGWVAAAAAVTTLSPESANAPTGQPSPAVTAPAGGAKPRKPLPTSAPRLLDKPASAAQPALSVLLKVAETSTAAPTPAPAAPAAAPVKRIIKLISKKTDPSSTT